MKNVEKCDKIVLGDYMKIMKKIVNLLFCKILYKIEYINLDNIKDIKKCIICPNHSNVFDPTFIYPVIDNLYIMAKSELFKNKFVKWLFLKYNIYPTNREKVDFKSLSYSLELFKNNEKIRLLMFPEGRVIKRKKDIGRYYRKGAVYISAKCEVPIIPVYITMRPKFFTKVKVIFGDPIYIDKQKLRSKRKIENMSKKIIDEIYKINDEELIK